MRLGQDQIRHLKEKGLPASLDLERTTQCLRRGGRGSRSSPAQCPKGGDAAHQPLPRGDGCQGESPGVVRPAAVGEVTGPRLIALAGEGAESPFLLTNKRPARPPSSGRVPSTERGDPEM